jgi:hypothetical protein
MLIWTMSRQRSKTKWTSYLFNKYKLIFESMDKFAKAKIEDKDLLTWFEVIKGTLR